MNLRGMSEGLLLLSAATLLAGQTPQDRFPAVQIDSRPVPSSSVVALQQGIPQGPAIQVDRGNPTAGPANLIVADVDSTSLRELLSGFAQSEGLNLAMPPQLDRLVSVDIRNATLEEALETVLDPLNLEYQIDGKILRVFETQMIDATLEFNYVTTSRTRTTSLAAPITPGRDSQPGSSVSSLGVDTMNLAEEVERLLQGAKSSNGDVQPNRMLGLYFVRDYPRNISRMRSILEQLQVAADRQVVIEAKLLEVELNRDSQSGIDWNSLLGSLSAQSASLGQNSPVYLTFAPGDVDSLLRALTKYGDVNVLAAPSIATLNNQPAVVRIGSQSVFLSTSVRADPRTGAIVQSAETPATVTEGIVLDMMPRVSADGTVYMNVHPIFTERLGQQSSRGSATAVGIREADTVIRVKSGDTILLAGLIRETERDSSSTGMRNTPIIRFLAGAPAKEVLKTDFVILLTPRIVTLQTAPALTQDRHDSQ